MARYTRQPLATHRKTKQKRNKAQLQNEKKENKQFQFNEMSNGEQSARCTHTRTADTLW